MRNKSVVLGIILGCLGVLCDIVGIIIGIYLGVWVMFIGGILNIITSVASRDTWLLVWGIFKILFCLAPSLIIYTGALVGNKLKRSARRELF